MGRKCVNSIKIKKTEDILKKRDDVAEECIMEDGFLKNKTDQTQKELKKEYVPEEIDETPTRGKSENPIFFFDFPEDMSDTEMEDYMKDEIEEYFQNSLVDNKSTGVYK